MSITENVEVLGHHALHWEGAFDVPARGTTERVPHLGVEQKCLNGIGDLAQSSPETRNPLTPWMTCSAVPPESFATTGNPAAIASSDALGHP